MRVRVSGRLAAGVAVFQSVSPGEEAKVQQACRGAAAAAALAVSVVINILHLHEPLGPEPPSHPLAEHGQVDQLSCKDISRIIMYERLQMLSLTQRQTIHVGGCFVLSLHSKAGFIINDASKQQQRMGCFHL